MYSQLCSGMGRDSSFTMFRPWTASTVSTSFREPASWGSTNRVLSLSAPGRSSGTGDTTTKRVVL